MLLRLRLRSVFICKEKLSACYSVCFWPGKKILSMFLLAKPGLHPQCVQISTFFDGGQKALPDHFIEKLWKVSIFFVGSFQNVAFHSLNRFRKQKYAVWSSISRAKSRVIRPKESKAHISFSTYFTRRHRRRIAHHDSSLSCPSFLMIIACLEVAFCLFL